MFSSMKAEIWDYTRKTLEKSSRGRFTLFCYSSNPPKIEIVREDSQQHPGLQVADFVAGAVFQYYERGKREFYEIIKPKLRLELRKIAYGYG